MISIKEFLDSFYSDKHEDFHIRFSMLSYREGNTWVDMQACKIKEIKLIRGQNGSEVNLIFTNCDEDYTISVKKFKKLLSKYEETSIMRCFMDDFFGEKNKELIDFISPDICYSDNEIFVTMDSGIYED